MPKVGQVIYVTFPVTNASDNYTLVPGLAHTEFTIKAAINGAPYVPASARVYPLAGNPGMYYLIMTGFLIPGLGAVEIYYPEGKQIFGQDFAITIYDEDDIMAAVGPGAPGGGAPPPGVPTSTTILSIWI